MQTDQRFSAFGNLPKAGMATKWLVGLLVFVSVFGALFERKLGFGTSLLLFDAKQVLQGQVWRVFTYAFVKTTPFGLLLSALVLWLFGIWFEARWGTWRFVRFFLASTMGGALLSIPCGYLVDWLLPFHDSSFAEGPDAAIDAMMVALALQAPDTRLLFGFVIPVPAKNLLLLLLGMDVIVGALTGVSTLSLTLGGMLMGYVLTVGFQGPKSWFTRWRRGRRGLYVVPPKRYHKYWLN